MTNALPRSDWLWFRWSLRDLRNHWVAVAAIALVMAIGVGVYAGLGSTATWRRVSNDESFAALSMHDLRATLSPGTFTEEGSLRRSVQDIDGAGSVTAMAERLVVDSQLDASTARDSILVAARIVGMDLAPADPVDTLWLAAGNRPDPGSVRPAAVLETKFADFWDLPASGTVMLAGDRRLDYTGVGAIPEDFFYEGPEGSIFSQGELAPIYVPLAVAQDLADKPGQVNDLVLTLAPDSDRAAIERQLRVALGELGISAVVTTSDASPAVRLLYDDIENDQRFWNALSGLVLAAAALAAFNLVTRIVESQRREIGIGMALGVPRSRLAIRPLVVGLEVALLGSLAGVGVGLLVGWAMKGLLSSLLPLPIYRTPFQPGMFARAAVLGLAIPIAASVLPVWRAVRVEPIEAIRTGHLTAKSSRLSDWTGSVRLPGSTMSLMPIRNVLRAPRRTVLTALGIGAAITALVAVLGLLDSIGRTIDQAGDEMTKGSSDRVMIQLDTFYPSDSPVIGAIADAGAVGSIDTSLRLPATAIAAGGGPEIDLVLEIIDLETASWRPTLLSTAVGGSGSRDGIILASKAADDLGVKPGDTIVLRHPMRTSEQSFAMVESEVTVLAVHANPIRAFAYMPLGGATRFGMAGLTNLVQAYPADGASRSDLQRSVFSLPGVTSSQAVARISEGFDEALGQFVGILAIAAIAVLVLALLIAFNATRITVDERRREHATMRAFGLPVRAVMATVVKESVIIGAMATVIGIGAGLAFLDWMLRSLAATTLPDLGITRYLSPATMAIAAGVGIAAVAVSPLFLVRRVRRMDIPDTLRVME